MKLRIRGDSVRLRLTRTEVDQLGRGESVSQTTHFGADSALHTTLAPSPEPRLRATFDAAGVTVYAPADALAQWAAGDDVGLDAPQAAPPLLLIEKDFACLVPREGGDDADTFAHPAAK